ncbi:MAG: Na+/H+ antiporter subunit B [Jannaschia helgolandensis]|jgi:multicomponent Na+:H+ antiporter subunit B|uniref:Multisubunit sodium/proton antiporter, MrpB subunit n=1 Tax=Jannaschia helgolandensis TaxID=188906 RepID=A0A1H7FJ68_9RHOB|nr:Na+/H+ antiporter subunit B [Jannaschia helgolandensis]SEK26081.1 multisubunit sodium/proton antiporter, MrpB subunit [Jannaschia helgolandensis]|tara:strand:+ start:1027 stop:1446 length:420 start_codon:yes stop_codon:yes gene_type:complete
MTSLIVRAATRLLVGLLLMFSIWMLLRGHNDPGGGFIGGLIGATGFILYAIAHGSKAAREALRLDPQTIAVSGLAVAFLAGLAGLIPGDAIFTGQWLFLGATEGDKGLPLSTILVFDLGVYLVVLGAVLTLVFALEEEI